MQAEPLGLWIYGSVGAVIVVMNMTVPTHFQSTASRTCRVISILRMQSQMIILSPAFTEPIQQLALWRQEAA